MFDFDDIFNFSYLGENCLTFLLDLTEILLKFLNQ